MKSSFLKVHSRSCCKPPLKIIQITDFHLFSDPNKIYRGVQPTKTLQKVLGAITANEADCRLIVASGDLVADEWEAYEVVAEMLQKTGIPALALPGNHDLPAAIQQRLAGRAIKYAEPFDLDPWSVIPLNSAVPGQAAGKLSHDELNRLTTLLQKNRNRHILLALHHQPVPVGSVWIDAIGLEDPAELFSIIEAHPQVKGVIFGHVHQEFDGNHGPVRLLGTPSTGLQFVPGMAEMEISPDPPAYRILELNDAGGIASRVIRV